jgi:hypothetical protein
MPRATTLGTSKVAVAPLPFFVIKNLTPSPLNLKLPRTNEAKQSKSPVNRGFWGYRKYSITGYKPNSKRLLSGTDLIQNG